MKFKIGEASRLLGVSTQTIRAYEQAGILKPQRSENGTRYFDEWQLVRLISFKKYRVMDLSIAQVVEHFRDDTCARFSGVLLKHAELLRARASALMRTAEAVDAHRRVLDGAPYALELCARPAQYRLDDLPGCLLEHRHIDALQQWLNALPIMAISPLVPSGALAETPTWGLSVSPMDAANWGVNTALPGVRLMPALPCARAMVTLTVGMRYFEAFEPALLQIREAGLTIDPAQEVWGRQLTSETIDGQIRLHYLFWFPIAS